MGIGGQAGSGTGADTVQVEGSEAAFLRGQAGDLSAIRAKRLGFGGVVVG